MVNTRRPARTRARRPGALAYKGNIGFFGEFLTRSALAQKQTQAQCRWQCGSLVE